MSSSADVILHPRFPTAEFLLARILAQSVRATNEKLLCPLVITLPLARTQGQGEWSNSRPAISLVQLGVVAEVNSLGPRTVTKSRLIVPLLLQPTDVAGRKPFDLYRSSQYYLPNLPHP